MHRFFIIPALIITLCASSEAAYRVFQLKITPITRQGKVLTKQIRTILTTLDQNQYASYHGGKGGIEVQYMDSWYCPGDTRYQRQYCHKPKDKTRAPSSLNPTKRSDLPLNLQPVR